MSELGDTATVNADVNEPVLKKRGSRECRGLCEASGGRLMHSVYRSVPFQICVACGVSFTAPGM